MAATGLQEGLPEKVDGFRNMSVTPNAANSTTKTKYDEQEGHERNGTELKV